jgi:NDP-sugar pyrophosphorylase family protein
MIPALVLTAGLATRLRPLSLVRAKAALPVAGEPLVRRILAQLSNARVTDVVLNLHHLPETITGVVGDGEEFGLRVRYSWENPVLGSAGGVRRAIPLLRNYADGSGSAFLVVNGDTLTDVGLEELAHVHHESGALVTLAVVPNTRPDKYGGVLVQKGGSIVTGFVGPGSSEPSHHFIGVQAADAIAFESVPEGVPYESIGALYPALMRSRPNSVRVFHCEAEFHDIGTPADYLETSLLFASRGLGNLSAGAGSRVDPSAQIERSILWDNVSVEAGARLLECVVTDGVRVPADTSWHGVTLRAAGELAPTERRIDGLAVSPLDAAQPDRAMHRA